MLGAYGNVGRYALKHLADSGKYELSALGRDIAKVKNDSFFQNISDVEWTFGDASCSETVEEFINGKDVILNTLFCSDTLKFEIYKKCMMEGIPCVDTGIPENIENFSGGSYLYGAGALPGLSSIMGVYAARGFSKLKSYTHITSMNGVFSKGSAYDYLSGVSKDLTDKKIPLEHRFGVDLPFIGKSDLYQYSDEETKIVTQLIGYSNGRHYITFGDPTIQKSIEHSVLIFASDPLSTAEKLVLQSKIHANRSREHMAFLIEVSGINENGTDEVRSLVIKFTSSPALTGLSAAVCTEIVLAEKNPTEILKLSELPEHKDLYENNIDMIVSSLRSSPEKIMFDEFNVKLEEMNEEMNGEI
nr:saccharopine dehydrogenase NADP-binding domain-containing protein [Ruminococcus sp.]